MLFKLLLALTLVMVFLGCNQPKNTLIEGTFDENFKKKNELADQELQTWQYKDIETDTIPGISLDRAYTYVLKRQKAKDDVIVAIIDSGTDIYHDDMEGHIWTNDDETNGNKTDDDGNGYIDDIHGWNFIGNTSGENLLYANLELARIIRKYKAQFNDKPEEEISSDELDTYQKYKRLLEEYNEELEDIKNHQKRANSLVERLEQAQKFVNGKLGKKSHTLEELEKIVAQDSMEEKHLAFIKNLIANDLIPQDYYNYRESNNNRFNYNMNLNYDDRQIVGDDPYNINDVNYGNNDIVGFPEKETHSTRVCGMITSYHSPDRKGNGFSDRIKIMPLRVSPRGSAYDKDVALAIRYAADNGAKVINMSFGKDHFTHKEWVLDAIKYANKKNVLIVTSAGNSRLNIDDKEVYLDDTEINNTDETVNNFIKVGASTHTLDKNLVSSISNYGKLKVDIFAPGAGIYTIWPNSENRSDRGTSLSSALVAGIAALIWVYYPKLSAAEVKDIILQSGTSYDIMVSVPGTKDKEQKPFSEFSKSGKIVNVYNALLMAEQVARKK